MAKIAVDLERSLKERSANGTAGRAVAKRIAQGDGWTVSDVVCTCGPRDRRFEERHTNFSIAVVAAGSFEYRSAAGRELMTPGSLLLGNAGQYFECRHDHGTGDRCVSFGFTPAYLERLTADAGIRGRLGFRTNRLPPLRELAPVVAGVCAELAGDGARWEELGVQLAARAVPVADGRGLARKEASATDIARVARVARFIDDQAGGEFTIGSLALEAGLSPFHFLRTFTRVTGLTPHQYILRARLRAAATRLRAEKVLVLDVALDCGFADVSNFNRAFRAEFGVSPRVYRALG